MTGRYDGCPRIDFSTTQDEYYIRPYDADNGHFDGEVVLLIAVDCYVCSDYSDYSDSSDNVSQAGRDDSMVARQRAMRSGRE